MDKANFEIVGNVGKIEIKTFGKTGKLATLSVATSERWKTEDGTQKDRTYWHRESQSNLCVLQILATQLAHRPQVGRQPANLLAQPVLGMLALEQRSRIT